MRAVRRGGVLGALLVALACVCAIRTAAGADARGGLPDSAAIRLGMLADSAASAPPAASKRGLRHMQDTVTVIRGIGVTGVRPVPERRAATSTHIDRAQVVKFLPQTTADALVAAPGVDLVKTGPWASRVSFRGLEGDRVLVLVDGVRLNTGRGHGSNMSLVSVDKLDQIDLLAGASGAEYGSDAMGGVINLVTHRPLLGPAALTMTLSTRGAEPGDEVGQDGVVRFVSPRAGAELSGGLARLDALVTPVGRVPNSGSHDDDFGARGVVRLGEGTLDVEHTRHAAHDVGLPAVDGSYPLISRDADRLEWTQPFVASALGWGVPAQAKLLGSHQRYVSNYDESDRDTVISQRTHRPIAFIDALARDRITTRMWEAQPELALGGDGALRIGAELRREDTQGPKFTTTTTRLPSGSVTSVADTTTENVPNARRDVLAASVAHRLVLGRATIETGARYDWVHSLAESTATSWSPRNDVTDRHASFDGGLSVHAGTFEPYGRIGTGFRVPNLEERYYRGPVHNGLRLAGNPDLVPERDVHYEAGVRIGHDDDWGSVRLSAYRTYAQDFITLSGGNLDRGLPSFTYANLARAQIDGLELAGRARLGPVATALSVALPRGRDLHTGDRLTEVGTSKVTLDAATSVGPWLPAGRFAVRLRWSDALVVPPLRTQQFGPLARPAFWTVATELSAGLGGGRAVLSVRNLLNHRYQEPLSFIDEPGRTFTFSWRRSFDVPLRGWHPHGGIDG